METLQRADERKIEKERHYDCLETDVREKARKNFKRQPYQTVSVVQYIAQKYGIGGDKCDKPSKDIDSDILDT